MTLRETLDIPEKHALDNIMRIAYNAKSYLEGITSPKRSVKLSRRQWVRFSRRLLRRECELLDHYVMHQLVDP